MSLEIELSKQIQPILNELYGVDVNENLIQLQSTRKDFDGDITLVVFPFLKMSKKGPEQTAEEIGGLVVEKVSIVRAFNVVKGFLNFSIGFLVIFEIQ